MKSSKNKLRAELQFTVDEATIYDCSTTEGKTNI